MEIYVPADVRETCATSESDKEIYFDMVQIV